MHIVHYFRSIFPKLLENFENFFGNLHFRGKTIFAVQGNRAQSVSFSERQTPFSDALKVSSGGLVFSDVAPETRASRTSVAHAENVANVTGFFTCRQKFAKETTVLSISGNRSSQIDSRVVERPLSVVFLRMEGAPILILVSLRRTTSYLRLSVL